jgi:hypothetical protein
VLTSVLSLCVALAAQTRTCNRSDKEKRVLLTDVIKHATGESPSMVEVAYELLLAQMQDGNVRAPGALGGDEEACEEFAEQCRIFAADILGTSGGSSGGGSGGGSDAPGDAADEDT